MIRLLQCLRPCISFAWDMGGVCHSPKEEAAMKGNQNRDVQATPCTDMHAHWLLLS